jgi:transglutaminase-like putative cysteine protease
MTSAFGDTIRDSSAPLHSTGPVRMMLAAQLTLLAVVVDLLAVVARRPALAGVPFLLLFTIAGAVPRHAVGWLWFGLAAAGYLLLLGSDARDELSRWGRLMPRNVGASRAAVKALSARRIGVTAIVLAVLVPLVLPVRSSNLLADALHGGVDNGSGKGGVSLSPFASLKGQLERKKPETLLHVTTSGLAGNEPFYLRQVVLDRYDASGWRQSDPGRAEPLDSTTFQTDPTTGRAASVKYTATIDINKLSDVNAPIFQSPTALSGLSGNWGWSSQNGVLAGSRTGSGDRYTEQVAEPDPAIADLENAREPEDRRALLRWLEYPANMSPAVIALVKQRTTKAGTPYARARAIFDYFSTQNGFSYNLATKVGDSGDDLQDFILIGKTGYCQQFAAAMAIMLRLADVPARVVLGYTHAKPDTNGTFAVTTNDAHAWVEAYFAGLGWVPFDPTPLLGGDAARAAALPWAPHTTTLPGSSTPVASGSSSGKQATESATASSAAVGATKSGNGNGLPLWAAVLLLGLLGLVIVVGLTPFSVRTWRRRSRLHASARGPDPLWRELADTVVDLGYVWSPVRSPRQVATWLKREGLSDEADRSLRTLAGAVELSRYAAPGRHGASTGTMVDDLRRVENSLRSTRSGWERVRARLLPESLGWATRLRPRGRH